MAVKGLSPNLSQAFPGSTCWVCFSVDYCNLVTSASFSELLGNTFSVKHTSTINMVFDKGQIIRVKSSLGNFIGSCR